MSRLKPREHYCLVFAVRGKRKIGSFYSPTKGALADYNQVQPLWIAELGDGCRIAKEGAVVGSKGFVHDVYEYEDVGVNLWPTYRQLLPKAVVAEIEKEVLDTDGILTANVLHENSIFALEDDCGQASLDGQSHGRSVDASAPA